MIKFRPAKKKDLKELGNLWSELYLHHKPYKDPYLHPLAKNARLRWVRFAGKNLKNKKKVILVAEENGKVVGFSHCEITFPPPIFKKKKVAEIHDFAISKKERSKGIGRKMMKALLVVLKKKGVKLARLEVHHKNERAEKFYRKYGFSDHMIHMMRVV